MKSESFDQSAWRRHGSWRWTGWFFFGLALLLHPVSFVLAAFAPPAPPDIRGIVPPQPFYVSGSFWWLAVAGVCLLLAALILWQILRPKRRPPAPPPSPREVAERRLRELEARMEHLDARTFGGAVCDVLRGYIGGEFGLATERQTSPEFLASINGSRVFSVREHHVLAEFLEACDLLKFARADATLDGKRHLLMQATEFLEHSGRPPQTPPLPGEAEADARPAGVSSL